MTINHRFGVAKRASSAPAPDRIAAVRPAWGALETVMAKGSGGTSKGVGKGGLQAGAKGGGKGAAKGWGGKTSAHQGMDSGKVRSPAPGLAGHDKAPGR